MGSCPRETPVGKGLALSIYEYDAADKRLMRSRYSTVVRGRFEVSMSGRGETGRIVGH